MLQDEAELLASYMREEFHEMTPEQKAANLIREYDAVQVQETDNHSCFYGCFDVATNQCPMCRRWYCAECREMWLPIDNQNWQESNMMCTQCHSEVYEPPKFE